MSYIKVLLIACTVSAHANSGLKLRGLERELADFDQAGICNQDVQDLKVDYPNADCDCFSNNVTDGTGGVLECQEKGCQYCGLGMCTERSLTRSNSYDLNGTAIGSVTKECHEFVSQGSQAEGETICMWTDPMNDICLMIASGDSCESCEYVDCGDGNRQPLFNCSNFRQDFVFNLCESEITVSDRNALFFVLDARFDRDTCTSAAAAVVGSSVAVVAAVGMSFAALFYY